MKKKNTLFHVLSLCLTILLLVQGMAFGTVAEVVEKPVANFSALEITTNNLLYGTTFYSDWKAADGCPADNVDGKGVDVSGSADNGAHKKMFLKTTLTLTPLTDGVDVSTSWKNIWLRLRSGKVDGNEQATEIYYIFPGDIVMTNGVAEISIPLSTFKKSNINWTDVRQLNVACELQNEYHLSGNGASDKIQFTLANTRIVRELAEGEVDKAELEDLVKLTVDESKYTAESVALFKQAIEAGNALLLDDAATQEQVDAAASAIKTAKQNLVSSKAIYKETLKAMIEETIEDSSSDLTAYENAKSAATPLLTNDKATQKQVNDAVLSIVKEKIAITGKLKPGDPYDTLATFSGSNQSWSYLQGGKQFYTDWKTLDSGALDASGDGANGAHRYIYLQMTVAFTALDADIDPTMAWKQIGVRLRGNGQDYEAGFFYVNPSQVISEGNGVYTLRVPLRSMSTDNINWADVRQLNVLCELNPAYYLTDEDGNVVAGDSNTVGFTLGNVSLVQKIVWAKGDVNNKDGITAEDALMALQAATQKITLIPYAATAADVDGEEGITAGDALMILQCATQKIGSLEQEDKKMVAFTFDDGPAENTAALLDALKERGVHATFFVVGKEAEKHPELVARMSAEGHDVGNHSYSHDGFNITGREEMIEDYDKCSDLIEEYTGKRPTLMRAVGGTSVDSISDYVIEQGLRLCGWVGGGPDYNQTDKNVVVNYYMKDGKCTITDGDLILLHENHASSVEAALELIDMLMADGYDIVTVQELLDARANGGQPGAQYSHVVDLG